MPKKNKQTENMKKTKQDNKVNMRNQNPKDDDKRDQARTRRNEASAKDFESTSNLESMESIKERGKFKRRIIESNWAKYEGEPVSDEESSMNQSERPTTTDFHSLVSQSGKEISSFKFKEEQEFELDQDAQQKLGANEEILSINLNSLSTSLKDIPIYQKLSLKHTLDMLDEKGLAWHGKYFQSLRETNIENLSVETNGQESSETVEWRFDDNDIETEVKRLLGRMRKEQKSIHNEYENFNQLHGEKSASPCETVRNMIPKDIEDNAESEALVLLSKDISAITTNRTGINSMTLQPTSSNLENAEDELEVLLSMTKPHSKSKQDPKKPSNDSCRNSSETNLACWNPSPENIDIENMVPDKNPELESTQKRRHTKENVAELEDWLDSMLQ
eukprot:Seg2770.1 transcript_id=Seg2770.1/GoldUCD/mRNA.D3Y31 product="Cell death regulator Aven" protein_id=Seg2770.1/GoldUCD/D3Y31